MWVKMSSFCGQNSTTFNGLVIDGILLLKAIQALIQSSQIFLLLFPMVGRLFQPL
jgi:hypothetical protein